MEIDRHPQHPQHDPERNNLQRPLSRQPPLRLHGRRTPRPDGRRLRPLRQLHRPALRPAKLVRHLLPNDPKELRRHGEHVRLAEGGAGDLGRAGCHAVGCETRGRGVQ